MLNRLRGKLKPCLEGIGAAFASTGLSPAFWTCTGLALALLSAAAYGTGAGYSALAGGALLLASGFFDMVDGQVARATGRASRRGEYLDSVSDKVAESAVFAGVLVGGHADPLAVLAAAVLSLLVGYARAKSEIAGVPVQGVGIGERAERMLLLALVGMAGFVEYAVIGVAVIAGVTLAQRIIHAARSL